MRRIIGELLNRLRPTKHFESGMDEEFQHHVEARTEYWMSTGMPRAEAARKARLEFGAQDRYRDEARETRWLWTVEEFLQDARYAIRSLAKARGFTLAVIATLMLGIGANTAVFSVVNGVMIRPLPFHEPERLVNLFQYGPAYSINDRNAPPLQQPVSFYPQRAKLNSFVDIVAFRNNSHILLGVDNPESLSSTNVSANFCQVLGVRLQLGRCFTELEETERAQVAIVSQSLWTRQFAEDPAVLGRTVILRGRFGSQQERDLPVTIIGVLPREFAIDMDYELFLPASHAPDYNNPRPSMEVARLRDGVTHEQAHAEMLSLQQSLRPDQYEGHGGYTMLVLPLFKNVMVRYSQQLLILMGVVSLLLLIACANVANLLLSRGAARMRELSTRAAVGAGRARIVRQLLTESTLLALAGGVAGLAAAMAGVRWILAVFGANLPRVESIGLDWRVLAYTVAVSLACGLLLGLIPALRLSKIDLAGAMKSGGAGSAGGRKQQRWMSGLLVAQAALCMIAAIGAGLLINTMVRLRGIDRGIDPQGVAIASLNLPQNPERASEFVGQVLDRVRAVPGLSAALIDFHLLARTFGGTEFRRVGTNDEFGPSGPSGSYRVASRDYFKTMGIPMLRGRDFTPRPGVRQADSLRSAIISESLARKYWPDGDPLGQTIALKGSGTEKETLAEIIGIVGDVRGYVSLPPEEMLYFDYTETGEIPEFLMVRGAGPTEALARTVRELVRSIDPNQTFRSSGSYAAMVDNDFRRNREVMTLLSWFAGLALVLTAVGVAGQAAYAVGRRKSEIAIRVSCGARPSNLLWMFCAASLKPVAIGVVLGSVGALAVTKYAQSLLFEITATDPATFAAAGAVTLAGAILAGLFASVKATNVDPAAMLRSE